MSEKTERFVKPGVPESKHKPSLYRCADCGEPVYKHENRKFWCEECGELKDHVQEARKKGRKGKGSNKTAGST